MFFRVQVLNWGSTQEAWRQDRSPHLSGQGRETKRLGGMTVPSLYSRGSRKAWQGHRGCQKGGKWIRRKGGDRTQSSREGTDERKEWKKGREETDGGNGSKTLKRTNDKGMRARERGKGFIKGGFSTTICMQYICKLSC